MPYAPGIDFFIEFNDLDPLTENRCIFYTQKRTRCLWPNERSDNDRAIALRQIIRSTPNKDVTLDQLQQYVLSNCCRRGNAQHQDRMVDLRLLRPLAQRWQGEIQQSSASFNSGSDSTSLENDQDIKADSLPSPSQPRSEITEPEDPDCNSLASQITFQALPSSLMTTLNSTPLEGAERELNSSEQRPRYHLRSLKTNIKSNTASSRVETETEPALSEFRPHIAEPGPDSSVWYKLLEDLNGRDVETGSLYIFNRTSSPGYVKIGWTAKKHVKLRLTEIAECDYQPNLLFSVLNVPNAQRAETLVHHELIKEWRRERRCKASWCQKSHKEWFEITIDRAKEVVSGWTTFLKEAGPYDPEGRLKKEWRETVQEIHERGELITVKTLLDHHNYMREMATRLEQPATARRAMKMEEIGSELTQMLTNIALTLPTTDTTPPSIATFDPIISQPLSPIKTNKKFGTKVLLPSPFLSQSESAIELAPTLNSASHKSPSSLLGIQNIPIEESPKTSRLWQGTSLDLEDISPEHNLLTSSSSYVPARPLESPCPEAPERNMSAGIESESTRKAIDLDKINNRSIPVSNPCQVAEVSDLLLSLSIEEQEELDEWFTQLLKDRKRDAEEKEISQLLLSLSISEQKELNEWLTSLTATPQDTIEDAGKLVLSSSLEAKSPEELADWRNEAAEQQVAERDNYSDSTLIEEESTISDDSWDADETLVTSQIALCLEKEALRIVDKLGQEATALTASTRLQGTDVLKALDTEAAPTIRVLA